MEEQYQPLEYAFRVFSHITTTTPCSADPCSADSAENPYIYRAKEALAKLACLFD